MKGRLVPSALGVCFIATMLGCAGIRPEASGRTGGAGGSQAAGGASGAVAPRATGGSGSGGTVAYGPGIDAAADVRPERCDDAGNCSCMNIASLGKVAHYGGNSDSTDAFQQYLNTKSNARLTLQTARATITPELLAPYDIVILQALEDSEYTGFWSYSADEIRTLSDWVKAGNALIALTGYGGDAEEVGPDNQLLAFAGISYGTADTFVSCPDSYCYCTDSSIPFSAWTPGMFLGEHMTAPNGGPGAVGLLHGRPITCTDSPDAPCQVVARDPQAGIVGVAKQVGKGRVFVWSDEWVTYTSQWGAVNTHGADCAGHTAGEIYDVPQFWFNVIHWLLPDASCFHIFDPIVIG
jgi:hypothetical protein